VAECQTLPIGPFVFYFSWWARKVAKEPSPAPLVSLPSAFSWRVKNSLADRRVLIDA